MHQTVFIVDDDNDLRSAIAELLQSVGLIVECFGSGAAFLDRDLSDANGCVLVDVRMPVMNGLELQQQLAARGNQLPLIFVTGHGDLKMGVAAMKVGAFDFITKPFHEQDLIDLVHAALAVEREGRADRVRMAEARRRYATLDQREIFVMNRVVAGGLNKVISAELGLSEITVKLIRRRVMDKMDAESLADLVRIAHSIGACPTRQ